ncbi:MAG: FCD domain-containing protein [Pseudomonadota bacterium]
MPLFGTEQRQALKANDDAQFFELDEAFHRQLFKIAGLPGAWEIMQTAKAEIDRVRHLKRLFGIRQRRLVVQEHAAIADAIMQRDPAAAERHLLDNIGATDDQMDSLSENPQLLQTIDDLNQLVALDGRSRSTRNAAKG